MEVVFKKAFQDHLRKSHITKQCRQLVIPIFPTRPYPCPFWKRIATTFFEGSFSKSKTIGVLSYLLLGRCFNFQGCLERLSERPVKGKRILCDSFHAQK